MNRRPTLFYAAFLCCLLRVAPAAAQDAVEKTTLKVMLGETSVSVNVYEKKGRRVTFFSPHHNEQLAPEAAREAIGKYGGRLIEVVSLDERGEPARRLRFTLSGKSYSVDPNRVFTESGRKCGAPPEAAAAVKRFAEGLLEIIFAPGGRRLRDGESFVVAVHNNTDSDEKRGAEKAADLTAGSFFKGGTTAAPAPGAYRESAAGAYLSNREADEDNFALVTTAQLLGGFAERGFNVVLQKPAAELQGGGCEVDDGSLSVYAALQNIPYVNLEADIRKGGARQREMLEAVYALLPK
jgi:hypothetical protein